MRLALALSAVVLVLAMLSVVVVAFFRGIPDDESAPATRPSSVRRVAAGPPESLRTRLKARLRVCRVHGHAWSVAYPLPGSQRVRQCSQCGKVAEPIVLQSYRRERA